jgi:predicted acylesterase/phospholipase RssA
VHANPPRASVLPPFNDGTYLFVEGGSVGISPVDVLREAGIDHLISVGPSQTRNNPNPRNGLGLFSAVDQPHLGALSSIRDQRADLVQKPHFAHSVGMQAFRHKSEHIAAGINAARHAE